MTPPLTLPLSACTDVSVVGGKAAGLACLMAAGFAVPPGICVTIEAYERGLQMSGVSATDAWRRICLGPEVERQAVFSECQSRIRQADVSRIAAQWTTALQAISLPSNTRWAVRSSATNEDTGHTSYAGMYRTRLGVSGEDIDGAIKDLWASLWQAPVVYYMLERGLTSVPPAMAVVIQPMLDAQTAGVAHSIHPLTGRSTQVAINAVFGLGSALVDGKTVPDQYVVHMTDAGEPVRIRRRFIADKREQLVLGERGIVSLPTAETARTMSSLSDSQLLTLAGVTKQIEKALRHPVDLEWVFEAQQLWIVQARPITAVRPTDDLTNDDCEWSRANFKETMPEVPSPLGLSFLEYFMERYIISHYRRLGCRIPNGLSSVRTLYGRPYLNGTLFYSLIAQLRGEPLLNAEHMGGEKLWEVPPVQPMGWLALMRAAWVSRQEIRRCIKSGPAWFAEMKQQAVRYRSDRLQHLSLHELAALLDELGHWLDRHEVTFGIVAGVGQALQALNRGLPRWLGQDWRSLLNAALQGQGTIISAQQILRLAELGQTAREDLRAQAWFLADRWDPSSYRTELAGTRFLQRFEGFLEDYGHRAVGESDVMSPRMAEQPESILGVLRTQVQAPAACAPIDILRRQEEGRRAALADIRRRAGWRWDRWAVFSWWYRRLTRLFALREANRHHLMYYSTAVRAVLMTLGERLVAEGYLRSPDDIFFITLEERPNIVARVSCDWKTLVDERRAAWVRHAAIDVPDTIRDWEQAVTGTAELPTAADGLLHGLPISVGCVTGTLRLVRTSLDWDKVTPGDIVVAPVIDPGMAPLFGVAGGLIVEMGGTLSHGAIIVREYGLPTVANVERAMTRLAEGSVVTLDADAGTVTLNFPSPST